jgi:acyl-CoA thioesterase-1
MTIRSGVLISHDRGRTWTPGADAGPDIPTMGLDEPALVRLANGDLFAILRTNQARPYETVSHDGGLTWDPVQPSRLRGFNSPAALCRLADGDILRAWDNSSANRYPLVVALSRDECETWSRARTVATPATTPEGGLSFDTACYPTIAQAADGTILLAWWQRARGRNSVHYARLSREWLDEVALTPQPPKVVAFGDSVTRGVRPGVTEAQTFAALLQAGLQERGVEVEVVNAGLGSDTTAGGLARMDRDVLAEEPQAVVIMFGLNDACVVDGGPVAREEPRVSLTDYAANLRTMVSRAQAAGAAVVLCTPNPMTRAYLYSDMSGYAENDDMNYLVREYAQAVEELGQEVAVPVVDVFSLFEDRPGGLDLIQDGCHPYVEGHRLIAEALLPVVQAALDRGR